MEAPAPETDNPSLLLDMTGEIVAAYVSHNTIRAEEMPKLITTVRDALAAIAAPKPAIEAAPELKSAVPIKKSITDDYIISLEDGRKFQSMKRYLSLLGMTPDDYRTKWGLPRDYPMVAPGYAARRSALAKASGLGSDRRKAKEHDELAATAPAYAGDPDAEAFEAPVKRRGRPKKVNG